MRSINVYYCYPIFLLSKSKLRKRIEISRNILPRYEKLRSLLIKSRDCDTRYKFRFSNKLIINGLTSIC